MTSPMQAPFGLFLAGGRIEGDALAGVTELEEAFNGPNGAAARADVLTQLSCCRKGLEDLRAQHLSRDVFAASDKLAAALDAAIVVILTPRKES